MSVQDMTREQLEQEVQQLSDSNFELAKIIDDRNKRIVFLEDYQKEARTLRSVVYCLEQRIEGYNKFLENIYETVGDIKISVSLEYLKFIDSEAKLRQDPNPTYSERFESNTNLLLEAIKEFVERVEKGEIRSKKTYAKFKSLLEKFEESK